MFSKDKKRETLTKSSPLSIKRNVLKENNTANKAFTFFNVNCRSLPKHQMDIFDLLSSEHPDAISLTETWLHTSSGPDVALALPSNSAVVRRDRASGKGGGIAIIYDKSYQCKLEDLSFLNCEAALFKLTLTPQITFSGILVYRPPGPSSSWASSLPDLITPYVLKASNFTILGDFNLHFNNSECSQ